MKKLTTIIALIAPLLICGCVSWVVPKTTISGSIGGQPFRYSGPKDQSIALISVNAATNGTVSIIVSNLNAKMNPDVISMSGQAQVEIINAVSAAVQQAAAKAAK